MTTDAPAVSRPDIVETPPMLIAACVVALATFYYASGPSWLLPILATSMISTVFVKARMQDGSPPSRLLRGGQILLVVIAKSGHDTKLMDAFFVAGFLDWFVFGIASEMAVECWLRSSAPGRGRGLVLYSCLVFFGGCATSDTGPMYVLAPLFFICLIAGIRQFTLRGEHFRPIDRAVKLAALVALALSIGSFAQFMFQRHKDDIISFGMQHIDSRMPQAANSTSGIDKEPKLSSESNLNGSNSRILRIDGEIDDPHLHGVSFDTYEEGGWKPISGQRVYTPVSAQALNASANGRSAEVIRFVSDDSMISAPLNCAGLRLTDSQDATTDAERTTFRDGDAPYTYGIVKSDEEFHQGPFAAPLSLLDRKRCLVIPFGISPTLCTLTKKLVPDKLGATKKIDAIVAFLHHNNSYSKTILLGSGDPVSNFVLKHQAGHCQFFASAAAIMLRIVGVPSRFAIGYYAHEAYGNHSLIVRGQDAHAWCEAWVDGTGWETVDATPGNGRPDHIARKSAWWGMSDRVQDLLAWLQLRAANSRGLSRLVAIVALALLVVGIAIWRLLQSRSRRVPDRQYSPGNPILANFARRFQDFLTRQNVPCPDDLPWGEHLTIVGPMFSKVTEARAFLTQYNRLRFGYSNLELDKESRILDELLNNLEKDSP